MVLNNIYKKSNNNNRQKEKKIHYKFEKYIKYQIYDLFMVK